MNMPLEQLLKVLFREVIGRLHLIVLCFIVLSISILVVGYNWPKKYSSSTSIYADRTNIIRPLMEGVADTTQVMSQVNAREVIFSRRTMQEILEVGGWMDGRPSPVEQERMVGEIKARTIVMASASGLIRIIYTDNIAERAFKVTSMYASMFLGETIRTKTQESREAYDFIDTQVVEYHRKLTGAENRLKNFRSENIDASPGRQSEVYENISQLRRRIDSTDLALKEAEIRKKSLVSQLKGEAIASKNTTTTSVYRDTLNQLYTEYDFLRLSYHDSYPDVVRTKQQIVDVKQAIKDENTRAKLEREKVSQGQQPSSESGLGYSLLYQQIQGNLSSAQTEIEMLKIRWKETKLRLGRERERAVMMSEGQALESELIRDYEVNQTIYQDLLRKRENARVSMHLDIEGRGLTYKIQEPANMPLLPTGLRFLHFLALGPLVGLGAPFGLLFVLVQIDPRIRMEAVLSDKMELPVLGVIERVPEVGSSHSSHYVIVITGLLLVGCSYLTLIWAKLTGFQPGLLLGGS